MNFFCEACGEVCLRRREYLMEGGTSMRGVYEELERCRRLHFVGIGGVSMCSLALMAAEKGYLVSGSDLMESDRTLLLSRHGIPVYRGNSPSNLPESSDISKLAVVYTAAVNADNPELAAARQAGALLVGRAELMGFLLKDEPRRVGVSGMHGKSTVCGMLAQIAVSDGAGDGIICGADIPCLGGAYKIGKNGRVVFEACEYKNSFLQLEPTVAVITNIEEEHLDFFRDIDSICRSFLQYLNSAERAVVCIDSPAARELISQAAVPVITCSARDRAADYYADNISFESGSASFDLLYRGSLVLRVGLRVIGEHNLGNAVTAAAVALNEGFSPEAVARGLGDFTGVKRRMEYLGNLKGAVIYDDYAHHPTEIRATLSAARQMGFRFISCAFQPHTYSRTAKFFCEFTRAFEDADEVLFADIYPAREEDVYGVSSRDLAAATPNGYYVPTAELIADHFRRIAAPNVLLLTMGAGELWRVGKLLISDEGK